MGEVTVTVDSRVYRLSAVKKAAYRLGDRCFSRINLAAESQVHVTLIPKSESLSVQTLEAEFHNELLDQDLRESIAEETERVRNLLLAQAFSGLSMTAADAETADYRGDPLGIGRSQVGES
jgi:His-Xaa-Ser system protein HxsD